MSERYNPFFEDLKQALQEAIEWTEGKRELKTTVLEYPGDGEVPAPPEAKAPGRKRPRAKKPASR